MNIIELSDKTRKYIKWVSNGFIVLGYVFFFSSPFIPQDKLFFGRNWAARTGVIFFAMTLVLWASTGKNSPTSIKFWVVSIISLLGMFLLGPQFLGLLYAVFGVGYILYKSFEELKGFLVKPAKSYRHLRSEVEKN